MRLNPDLIRNILLKTELGSFEVLSSINYDDWFSHGKKEYQKPQEFLNFSDIEIEYHVDYLIKSDFITTKATYGNTIDISDLTIKGHNFVSNIKNDENWNKIKEISDNIGSSSVETLIKISDRLISELINNQFTQN